MANSANIFKNSLAAAGYVTPAEWSKQIEQVAREKSIMRSLTESLVVFNRIGTSGNTEYIQKNSALTAAAVTDGNSIGISALSFTQVAVSASQIGVATQITLKQLRDQLSTVRSDVIMNLGTALAEKEEVDIITELYTTTSADIYANSKTAANITTGDTFNVALLIDGKTAQRVDKRYSKYLLIHPNQYADLAKLQQFTDAAYLGSDRVNREGFIGRFFGVDVYQSVNVGTVVENTVTVYKSLLLAERALAILDKKAPTLEMDRGLVQDLSMTFIAYQDVGYALLNPESVRVLKSS